MADLGDSETVGDCRSRAASVLHDSLPADPASHSVPPSTCTPMTEAQVKTIENFFRLYSLWQSRVSRTITAHLHPETASTRTYMRIMSFKSHHNLRNPKDLSGDGSEFISTGSINICFPFRVLYKPTKWSFIVHLQISQWISVQCGIGWLHARRSIVRLRRADAYLGTLQ